MPHNNPTSALKILDIDLALSRSAGNRRLADDLLKMLIRDLPDYKATFLSDVTNKERLKDTLHKLHGGLRYIGAPSLMAIVSITDEQFLQFDEEKLTAQLQLIAIEIDKILEENNY